MLTNRHKQTGIRGAGRKARLWPCMPETGRGGAAVAGGAGVCLSASSGYLAGRMPELWAAISVENPRFADQSINQV